MSSTKEMPVIELTDEGEQPKILTKCSIIRYKGREYILLATIEIKDNTFTPYKFIKQALEANYLVPTPSTFIDEKMEKEKNDHAYLPLINRGMKECSNWAFICTDKNPESRRGALHFSNSEYRDALCFEAHVKYYLDDAYLDNGEETENAMEGVREMIDAIFIEWEKEQNDED